MATMLGVMIPLFGGMLIPVWIPIIAVAVGAALDRVRPPQIPPARTQLRWRSSGSRRRAPG